jgi:hypothetical protein
MTRENDGPGETAREFIDFGLLEYDFAAIQRYSDDIGVGYPRPALTTGQRRVGSGHTRSERRIAEFPSVH